MEAHELVDVGFPVRGGKLPADHGYLLFSALCDAIPRLSHEPGWALLPVDGTVEGGRRILLGPRSMVQLRLPARELGEALTLTGRDLAVGAERVHLGMARVRPLSSSPRLRSAAVTIQGATGPAFLAALRRELAALPLGQDPATMDVRVGEQRFLRARVRTVVGHEVELSGLRPRASLCIQAHGLGGRRHMGAGVFLPLSDAPDP
ncbi:type I-MYXAN CRISPR-associated protein Cas6/Cmx6 [Paraliomyxa miuraensis]|uniref:type I-MYXAN CRISPR-associated protein Cas6/Cmx6 n=1 Tax=Paraliomyxa miuraensis TaxID=376150 RepID=UPI00224FCBEB|nr:type I-MYXAN CRISPR-associated protein Cas6/Cmx6 [Paraliomyxa miuraensis]MCX4245360.1 type I-MYXAN CRISPR-associated protein Cas6/Cmx6 [Paraliomyxa miuraensis]